MSDGEGLFLLVKKNGSRLWRLAYRFNGRQKTLALGAYPAVGLAKARSGRADAKTALVAGRDPGEVKKAAKRASDGPPNTFAAVAARWFDARKGSWVESYSGRIWARIRDDIIPEIGAKAVSEITASDVLGAVRKIEARNAVELAHRIKNHVSDIFRFAKAEGLIEVNPAADLNDALRKPKKGKRRTALPARDLPAFLEALKAYDGEDLTRLAVRLTLLTFVRTNEMRFARRTEFEDLGGKEPLWRIPPGRMKMDREHIVPLSRQAVAVVQEILRLNPKSELLFPAATRSGVISENTMLYALYRMGYHSRATIHGFRGTASTVLNENGFNEDWIERQLAHAEEDKVRAAYNAAEWLADRRAMMQWWADYLDRQAEVGALVG